MKQIKKFFNIDFAIRYNFFKGNVIKNNYLMQKYIIVSSHPRSGTHFLIDSLILNFKNLSFPKIRPSYATIENLLLPHDQEIFIQWEKWLSECKKNKLIPLIKTHCLPDDIETFIKTSPSKEAILLKNIYYNSTFIYIKRDPVNTLKSWFEFAKGGTVVTLNSAQHRFRNLNFKDFLFLENLHKMPHRNFSNFDRNLIEFLSYHHASWAKLINEKESGIVINYEDLKDNYENTLSQIFIRFKFTKHKKYIVKPFTQNQAKIFRYILSAANKFKLMWIIEKLNFFKKISKASSVPPSKKLKINIDKADQDIIQKIYKKVF